MGILDMKIGGDKSISELNNLKRKVLYEEERIVEIFSEIGKLYYKNTDGDLSELNVLCEDINTRRRRIRKMKAEMCSIRGFKICPKCDAEVNEKFQFCGVCGARVPDLDSVDEDEDTFFDELENNVSKNSRGSVMEIRPNGSV